MVMEGICGHALQSQSVAHRILSGFLLTRVGVMVCVLKSLFIESELAGKTS